MDGGESHGEGPWTGSRGRGLREALVGSTGQRVIRHAPCPVVVLPDPRHAEQEVRRLAGGAAAAWNRRA